ncbi:MAG: hypothetical protein WCW16_00225 [Candidatus Magasanikbacteria bacterium]
MQDIQSVFNRVQEAKRKQKDLRSMYKDALVGNTEYQDLVEKRKSVRETMKRIEISIREQFSKEMTELEDIKIDIDSDMELLSDIALSKVTKGEIVEITDADNNNYEPIFSVKFKKVK